MNYKPWLAIATATSHLIQRGCNTSDRCGVTAKSEQAQAKDTEASSGESHGGY